VETTGIELATSWLQTRRFSAKMIDAKSFCKSGYDLPLRRSRIPAFIRILRELSSFLADSLPRQSFIRR